MEHLKRTISTAARDCGNCCTKKESWKPPSRLLYLVALMLLFSRLRLLQNAGAWLGNGLTKRKHISLMLNQLHCLPIHSRGIFKSTVIVHKAINMNSLDFTISKFSWHRLTRARGPAHQFLLAVARARTVTYGDRSFSIAAVKT